MNARHLAVQLALAALVLLALNAVVDLLAANSIPRQLLRAAERSEPATHLFLGNSTMAAGCDEAAFARAHSGCRPLNLGFGSSSPVEHYLIYRQQHNHGGATVYYGFLDTQLTDPPAGDWSTLVGNRAMAYYVEPDVARQFYTAGSPARDLSFQVCSHVPMMIERYAVWAKVERLRRMFGELGMPARANNRFGRAEDFAQLEQTVSVFAARCEQAVTDRVPLSAPVAALFRQAQGPGHRLNVIEMPMPRSHRDQYYRLPAWAAYRAHLKDLVQSAGGTYIEASDWIGDDGFADALHLNSLGAEQFSGRLGREFP